ncbi:hypothetical protein BDK51DRAFT_51770, partial [Blyttiomyces helicus]
LRSVSPTIDWNHRPVLDAASPPAASPPSESPAPNSTIDWNHRPVLNVTSPPSEPPSPPSTIDWDHRPILSPPPVPSESPAISTTVDWKLRPVLSPPQAPSPSETPSPSFTFDWNHRPVLPAPAAFPSPTATVETTDWNHPVLPAPGATDTNPPADDAPGPDWNRRPILPSVAAAAGAAVAATSTAQAADVRRTLLIAVPAGVGGLVLISVLIACVVVCVRRRRARHRRGEAHRVLEARRAQNKEMGGATAVLAAKRSDATVVHFDGVPEAAEEVVVGEEDEDIGAASRSASLLRPLRGRGADPTAGASAEAPGGVPFDRLEALMASNAFRVSLRAPVVRREGPEPALLQSTAAAQSPAAAERHLPPPSAPATVSIVEVSQPNEHVRRVSSHIVQRALRDLRDDDVEIPTSRRSSVYGCVMPREPSASDSSMFSPDSARRSLTRERLRTTETWRSSSDL